MKTLEEFTKDYLAEYKKYLTGLPVTSDKYGNGTLVDVLEFTEFGYKIPRHLDIEVAIKFDKEEEPFIFALELATKRDQFQLKAEVAVDLINYLSVIEAAWLEVEKQNKIEADAAWQQEMEYFYKVQKETEKENTDKKKRKGK